eukprot:g78631.t1
MEVKTSNEDTVGLRDTGNRLVKGVWLTEAVADGHWRGCGLCHGAVHKECMCRVSVVVSFLLADLALSCSVSTFPREMDSDNENPLFDPLPAFPREMDFGTENLLLPASPLQHRDMDSGTENPLSPRPLVINPQPDSLPVVDELEPAEGNGWSDTNQPVGNSAAGQAHSWSDTNQPFGNGNAAGPSYHAFGAPTPAPDQSASAQPANIEGQIVQTVEEVSGMRYFAVNAGIPNVQEDARIALPRPSSFPVARAQSGLDIISASSTTTESTTEQTKFHMLKRARQTEPLAEMDFLSDATAVANVGQSGATPSGSAWVHWSLLDLEFRLDPPGSPDILSIEISSAVFPQSLACLVCWSVCCWSCPLTTGLVYWMLLSV